MGYPFIESIRSLLPLVDEYVINIGDSDDDTYERVSAIDDPRIRILRSRWNDGMRSRGFVYAQQKMIAQYNCTGDWAFYLEGDEVLHAEDLPRIRESMEGHVDNPRVEALAFHYHHFYGRPDQVLVSGALCRNEVRVIRNNIRSYAPDGLFWMVMTNHRRGRYPYAAHTGAYIYHYGWVRATNQMVEKFRRVYQYWDQAPPSTFDYGNVDARSIGPFKGEHPAVVRQWLEDQANWEFRAKPNYEPTQRERRHHFLTRLRRRFGLDLSKRHYTLLR
jgi:hypothetical protein